MRLTVPLSTSSALIHEARMPVLGVMIVPALQGKKGEEVEEVKEEKISSVFVPSIEAAVHEFVAKWQLHR